MNYTKYSWYFITTNKSRRRRLTKGLDIYTGALTRYYSHNWKTVVQQWAEVNGYSFRKITPGGEPAAEEELTCEEVRNIQNAVKRWRDTLLDAIHQKNGLPYTPWPEDNEKPYYTNKPDWDAFGTMLLVAACHTYGELVPPTVERGWNFAEHPLIVLRQTRKPSFAGSGWRAISQTVSSRQAERSAMRIFRSTPSLVHNPWPGFPSLYSGFWQAMQFAEKQQVPILLDF